MIYIINIGLDIRNMYEMTDKINRRDIFAR